MAAKIISVIINEESEGVRVSVCMHAFYKLLIYTWTLNTVFVPFRNRVVQYSKTCSHFPSLCGDSGTEYNGLQYLFTITKGVRACVRICAHTCACVWHWPSLILPYPLSISKELPKREWTGEGVHATEEGKKIEKK